MPPEETPAGNTPPKKLHLKPSASTINGATIGLPLGIVIVWVISSFLIPPTKELPVEVASSIGSIVAQLAGLFFPGGRAADME